MRKVTVEVPAGALGEINQFELVERPVHPPPPTPADRARRILALSKIFGMWKGRTDIPTDGLEYQRLMRDE